MEEKTLKEFIDEVVSQPITIKGIGLGAKLLEQMLQLEGVERYLNSMYGIELKITVVPVERKEGRFYGKGLLDNLA